MLDLYDFQAEIRHKGVLSQNKYRVRIDPVGDLPIAGDSRLLRALSLRAVNAVLPGINLATKDDVLRYGYGPLEKMPFGVLYGDTHLSFLVDVSGKVYNFFYKWMHFITNGDSSGSMYDSKHSPVLLDGQAGEGTAAGSGSDINPYTVEYKDSYIADMTIETTSDLHNGSLKAVLYRAFPIAITEIPLDAAAQNSPIILTVTFSYRDHKIFPGK